MELLWPGEDPAKLGNRLSVALSALRGVVGAPTSSDADDAAVSLDLERVDVDVERLLTATDPAQVERAVRRRLPRGGPLRGLGDSTCASRRARRTRPRCGPARARRATTTRPSATYLRLLEHDRWDASAHRELIARLDRAGRHGEAIRRRRGVHPRDGGNRRASSTLRRFEGAPTDRSGPRPKELPMLRRMILAAALAAIPAADAQAAPLNWTPCDDGFQCATAQVPLDYDQPDGHADQLALIRLPATDPAHRIGTLFTNPGGPGNSGVAVRARRGPRRLHRRRPGALRRRRLRPARRRGQHAGRAAAPATPQPAVPRRRRAGARLRRRPRPTSAAAAAPAPATLLDHLSTANVARDMDVLRAAVGDPKLTFVGHSYGSHLGATYANLFPQRVRAIVLDGVLDSGGVDDRAPARSRCASAASRPRATRCATSSTPARRPGRDCAFSDGDPARSSTR